MKILSELKRLLLCIGLSKATSLQVNGWTISRALIRSTFVSIWVGHTLLEFLNCVESLAYGFGTFLIVLHICLMSAYTFIIGLSLMSDSDVVLDLFEFIECVINRRLQECNESRTIYEEQNNFNDKVVRLWFPFITIFTSSIFGMPTLCVLLFVCFGAPSPKYWQLPLPLDYAFATFIDLHAISGFLSAVALEALFTVFFATTTICFAAIYVSVCMHVSAIIDDMVLMTVLAKEDASKQLRWFVQLCLDCYTMLEMLATILDVPIFFQMPCFGVVSAIALFYFENTAVSLSFEFIFSLNHLGFLLTVNFLLCYSMNTLTTNSCAIGDIAYDAPWYCMGKHERYMVQMMIIRAQKPFEVRGMGIFECSLAAFSQMLQNAISFYMIFRRLN